MFLLPGTKVPVYLFGGVMLVRKAESDGFNYRLHAVSHQRYAFVSN